jgi:hypothetical protein
MTHWSTGSTATGLVLFLIPDVAVGAVGAFFGGPVGAGVAIVGVNVVAGGLFLFGTSGWGDDWGHPEGTPARTVFGKLVMAVAEDCDPFDPSPLRRCHAFDF